MALRLILLDVEGTTTPISFVYDKLFPYARSHMRVWLQQHHLDPEVHNALLQLEKENVADLGNGAPPFSLTDDHHGSADSAAGYCLWLMDRDRKTTPLKTMQRVIW